MKEIKLGIVPGTKKINGEVMVLVDEKLEHCGYPHLQRGGTERDYWAALGGRGGP